MAKPEWKPDIHDASLIDEAKADFIYESAKQFLGETIDLADDLKKSSTQALIFLIGILSVVSSYLLLKCDIAKAVCNAAPQTFFPAGILLLGYFFAAMLLIMRCLTPRCFHFRGNEPRNLICIDVCQDDINMIKVRSAIGIQKDINENVAANLQRAKSLIFVYRISVVVPVIGFIVALIMGWLNLLF